MDRFTELLKRITGSDALSSEYKNTTVLAATDPIPESFPRDAFRNDLLHWFDENKRDLPWRRGVPSYHIWLSEIMLQQTRVDQVIGYYHRFIERFPSVVDLAQADLEQVLLMWEGLGYYSRARNLHKGAQDVVHIWGGSLPESYDDLLSITGIGPYTAAAISSIAFGHPHAVVDGNVIRVLSRLFAFGRIVSEGNSKRWMIQTADDLLDKASPGSFNEAMMELGAMVCTPRNPDCTRCPVATCCSALTSGNTEAFPVKKRQKRIPHLHIAVGVIHNSDGGILVQKRADEAMLGGLWEFPGGKQEPGESLEETCVREIAEETGLQVTVQHQITEIDHAYSHFRITLHAFACTPSEPYAIEDGPTRKWIVREHLKDYPFPRANRKLLEIISPEEPKAHAGTPPDAID